MKTHSVLSACNAGDLGSIPGSGRSPGGGHGNPLQYSCLENPVDRGAWWATVHGVAKSRTRLKQLILYFFTFAFVQFYSLWVLVAHLHLQDIKFEMPVIKIINAYLFWIQTWAFWSRVDLLFNYSNNYSDSFLP